MVPDRLGTVGAAYPKSLSRSARSASRAASGAMASAWDVESESEVAPTVIGRAAAAPVLATAAPSAEWGGLWVGLLGVTTLLMLFLAFVSMDLVRNLYDYRGDSPASGIVRALAGLFG
jgi:hypothetical protein